ncbi:GL21381 [Drosophila persimilis]|uniref:GL21381 n=1 Tax=Drosophila persimilis TaxID=7234 RepID=B4HAA4_DROPE|nr:GL21381 [Drosophila persimilis]
MPNLNGPTVSSGPIRKASLIKCCKYYTIDWSSSVPKLHMLENSSTSADAITPKPQRTVIVVYGYVYAGDLQLKEKLDFHSHLTVTPQDDTP